MASVSEASVKIDASCQYEKEERLPSHRSLGCGEDEVRTWNCSENIEKKTIGNMHGQQLQNV